MSEEWTSLKLVRWTTDYFEKKGIPNPRLDAELLLAHVLGCKRVDLYTGFEKLVGEQHLASFKSLVERRARREPLQYILGETEFWGLKFKVTPEVLIPRPETELLVEEALKHVGAQFIAPGQKKLNQMESIQDSGRNELRPYTGNILDIGTGSGCIPIALAKNLPDAKIVATDISKGALVLARENAETNEVSDRIEFVLADLAPWNVFRAQGQSFDLIISNPPYIASDEFPNLQPEVRDFEPRKALDGGPDGLDIIRKLFEEAPDFLRPDGFLVLEIGENEAEPIKSELGKNSKLVLVQVKKDYAGLDRIVICQKKT